MIYQVGRKPQMMLVHMFVILSFISLLFAGLLVPTRTLGAGGQKLHFNSTLSSIKTIFLIMMENKNWSSILRSASAPYINKTLLPMASYTSAYYTPPHNHPSLANYLWLEAGTNFGITNDSLPGVNHQSTTDHLVTLLANTGHSWKAYAEGISGTNCPLKNNGLYTPHHNATLYFDDVTAINSPTAPYCIAHERPFQELATDLANNTVANYNFIEPNLCDDMHNSTGCPTTNRISNGDTWLSAIVPEILNSQAYLSGGLLFITWDEGGYNPGGTKSDGPIGLIVLSPYAKGNGYSNSIYYTHSSTLLTIEEIFGLSPLLGDAANATDLSDLFLSSVVV